MKGAEADYKNLEVTLHKTRLDLQSMVAQTSADYNTAKLEADRDEALTKENLLAATDSKISRVKADQLSAKFKIDQERLESDAAAQTAQLEAQKVKVDNLKSQYDLKKSQVDKLNIRAGVSGMLQSVPPPLIPVEEGQKVAAGTVLTREGATPWSGRILVHAPDGRRGWLPASPTKPRIFRAMTGNTHGMMFRINPPINA